MNDIRQLRLEQDPAYRKSPLPYNIPRFVIKVELLACTINQRHYLHIGVSPNTLNVNANVKMYECLTQS